VTTLKEIVQDLAAMAKRDAVTDHELRRLLGYLLTTHDSRPQESNATATRLSANTLGSTAPVRRRRRYSGRGSYGWVNLRRAEDICLVGLLELNGSAARPKLLEYIKQKWGSHFTQEDEERLPMAEVGRWVKTCDWAIYNLVKQGLVDRSQRGLRSLTSAGRQEALGRKNRLL
jgi:restriction endonuclease Mrr